MSIRDAVAAASSYLLAHPEEARYVDGAATARLDGGLAVVVSDPGGREIRTDMVTGIGGGDLAPSPGWLMRAALASCLTTFIALRAAVTGASIDGLVVECDSESDDRGILGLEPDVPPGPLAVRLRVRASSVIAGSEPFEAVVEWAVAHCPVTDAVERAVPLTVTVG